MPVLADLFSVGNRIKRNLADLIRNPNDYAQQWSDQLRQDVPEMIRDPANYFPGGGAVAQTVWHGSPHKFSKFDMSKIGTGEGAQAYGHGLYMADSPAVAKTYQDQLSKPTFIEKRTGRKISPQEQEWQDVLDRKFRMESNGYGEDFAKKYDMEVGGQLYKVDIPDEAVARFLDWDKPLSQQGNILNRTGPHGESYSIKDHLDRLGLDDSATGKQLMQELGYGRGKERAQGVSEYLNQYGIPGIRYLDRQSRGGVGFGDASGTANFVLFDDQLPRIIDVNGVPTGNVPWSPGEWKQLGDLVR